MRSIRYKILTGFCLSVALIIAMIVVTVTINLDKNMQEQSDSLALYITENTAANLEGLDRILNHYIVNIQNDIREIKLDAIRSPELSENIEYERVYALNMLLKKTCTSGMADYMIIYKPDGEIINSYPKSSSNDVLKDYYLNSPLKSKVDDLLKRKIQSNDPSLDFMHKVEPGFLDALKFADRDQGAGGVVIESAGVIQDEYGGVIAVCFAGKLLNGYHKPFELISGATGAATALYVGDMPIAHAGFLDAQNKADRDEFKLSYGEIMDRCSASECVYRVLDINNKSYLASCLPFRDSAGSTVGLVVSGIPEAEVAKAQQNIAAFGAKAKSNMLKWLIGIGVVSLALFAIISLFLSAVITRPILKCAHFAKDLAKGRLDRRLESKSRDEIGTLAADLNKVPEILNKIVAEVLEIVDNIDVGRLKARGNPDAFEGDFADLVGGVNKLADVYTGHINSLPLPIIIHDRDYNLLFANDFALKQAGKDNDEVQGTKCYDLFSNVACRTEDCPSAKAMSAGKASESNVRISLNGSDMEFHSLSVPVFREEAVVGALEMLFDETEIKTTQRNLQKLAEEAIDNSGRVFAASEDLALKVEHASSGAAQQKISAAETSTAMEQMNVTVMEVAKNAGDAAQNADETKTKAEEGSLMVNEVVELMNSMRQSSEDLQNSMNKLGEQADGISKIIGVINDIADQTNLLALNAAIEAARAGDAGRGFAVVADEVRKLAEKTMGATKEVESAIHNIQEMTRANIEATLSTAQAIVQGAQKAQESGDVLAEIVSMVEVSADQIRGIATAVEEQSAASDQVSKAAAEINKISQETSELMQQSTRAIQGLAKLAENLKALIKDMQSGQS